MTPYLWEQMTWDEFKSMVDSGVDTALLPCGSIEQHGKHMPLGSDAFIAHALCKEIANSVPALVAPPIYWGCCSHPYDVTSFPGVHTLDDDLLIGLYVSIAASLSRHGIRRFVLMNAHAGNSVACELAVQQIRRTTGGAAGTLSWRSAAGSVIAEVREQGPHMGIHACEIETSVALALMGDMVDMNKVQANPKIAYPDVSLSWDVDPGPRAWFNWDFDKSCSEPGNMGDPRLASVEKGRRIVEATVEVAKQLLGSLARQLDKE
jgi:creatinine amidohydrolase